MSGGLLRRFNTIATGLKSKASSRGQFFRKMYRSGKDGFRDAGMEFETPRRQICACNEASQCERLIDKQHLLVRGHQEKCVRSMAFYGF